MEKQAAVIGGATDEHQVKDVEPIRLVLSSPEDDRMSKFWTQAASNPFVPIGLLLTTASLIGIIVTSYKGQRMKSQYWMRARIAFQFLTFVSVGGGAYYGRDRNGQDQAVKATRPVASDFQVAFIPTPSASRDAREAAAKMATK